MSDALDGTAGRRRIYLMRHGEVRYFDADGKAVHPKFVDLTERGQAQAATMGELLADVPFDRALCTGLPRTVQTAQGVLAGRNLVVEDIPALKEIRSGPMGDKSQAEIDAKFVFGMDDADLPRTRFAGGDLFEEFYTRVTTALEALLREPGWRNLLLVAHDGTNRMLLGWASYGGLASARAFDQDPGCLNVIDADVGNGEILRRTLKLSNLTPINHSKLGNNLTSMEQVFDYRRQVLAGIDEP
ncbi:MAG: histidine phosphatase family protein [Alphaproteobacteria bacterium]|jgi:probable phosphoglycerate mutase|nr:phosphoglycerate mutase [Rhodospirillaceae bacterium]MDP6023265.1 histidine phosphatase family protein [Alphaproteobacteria bacterium]MDP6255734.1 histidine phosphatase family protein [Alphaproteobacteria bacterium]MDP7052927.1 histidine phosphatase family protein [Alphaproteobacteria bacterium]MDP7228733.1 histidine phosphatase family protein [Alphaproteobacteria bacterium]|tara:strand:+ start:290 stop:1018 length:729 start_codon:yes stop_codon:yes gene_type:complete